MCLQEKLNKLNSWVILVLRISMGVVFITSGWHKFQDINGFAGYLTSMHIPFALVQAYLVATLELVGGILFALGFFTRWAALAFIPIMIVAILTAHRAEITSIDALFKLLPWNYLWLALFFATSGCGDNKKN